MEVEYNAVQYMNMNKTYLKKICCCGSALNIQNKDVIKLTPDAEGKIYLHCPCCDKKISLYKYFGGKMYTAQQYAECMEKFHEETFEIIKLISGLLIGFGTEYFVLEGVYIIPSPAKISFRLFINRYEHNNWENQLTHHELFSQSPVVDISGKVVCETIYEYAQYVQAFVDFFIRYMVHQNPHVDFDVPEYLDLKEDTSFLTEVFRDPEIDIDSFEFDPIGLQKTKYQMEIEARTLYTPDIKEGLFYTGDKIEAGCADIAASIRRMACTVHNSSIRRTETPALVRKA